MLTCLPASNKKFFNVLSFDTEADSAGKTYVWCVAGYYKSKEINQVFTSRAACQKYLFEKQWDNCVLTGLNLAFDLNTLYGRKSGFKWETITNMGRLITAFPGPEQKKKHNFSSGRYLRVIDLGNYIQNMSLKQMADIFGVEGHIDKHILGRDGDKKELTEACLSHCWAGVKIFKEIERVIRGLGGEMKLTGPATALDLFRRRYLKKEHQIFDKKKRGETDEEKEKREKEVKYIKQVGKLAYVGGRTESFKLGLYNNAGYIDINSSYPFQMSSQKFPDMSSWKRYTKNLDFVFLKNLLEREEGQALVRVKAPKLKIPLLHTTDDSKLIFPTGEIQRWYTFPELRYALELGYQIKEIFEIISFRRLKENPFKDFVYDMNEYKKKCKPVAKLLMNGLSGKFGQRKPENEQWELVDESEDVEVDYKEYFEINGQLWKFTPQQKTEEIEFVSYAYPLIVAYITAYGRIQEHKAIMAIGPENVYYMDTDSIIADKNAIKKANLDIHKSALGAYSYEYTDATVELRGEKYYRIRNSGEEWTYHIKGVPARVSAQHWRYRKSAYYRPRKIRTALRTGLQVNEFIRVFRRDVSKPSKRIYDRRDSEPRLVRD